MFYAVVPWQDRIQALDGEFHSSAFDNGLRFLAEAASISLGALSAGTAWRDRNWALGAFGLAVIAGTWFFLVRRNGIWYRFDRGSVSACSSNGTVLWHEALTGLTEVRRHDARGFSILILRWPDRRRYLPLYSSLEKALSGSLEESGRAGGEFSQGAAPIAEIDDPRRKAWRCRTCGEENPPTFEICWNCEKSKD